MLITSVISIISIYWLMILILCCSSLLPAIVSEPDGLSCLLQVDPGNTGKVGAADAAQFLKKSGLSDSTLGQVRQNNHITEHLKTLRCSAGAVGRK